MLLNHQGSAIEANDGNAITDPIPSEHQLRSDVAYINSMLTKLGMDCPLALLSLEGCDGEGREGRRWELGQAISVLIPLLQTRIREQAFRSEVEDRVRRLAEDLQEKTGQFEKQQSRSDDLQRQLVAVKEELRYQDHEFFISFLYFEIELHNKSALQMRLQQAKPVKNRTDCEPPSS